MQPVASKPKPSILNLLGHNKGPQARQEALLGATHATLHNTNTLQDSRDLAPPPPPQQPGPSQPAAPPDAAASNRQAEASNGAASSSSSGGRFNRTPTQPYRLERPASAHARQAANPSAGGSDLDAFAHRPPASGVQLSLGACELRSDLVGLRHSQRQRHQTLERLRQQQMHSIEDMQRLQDILEADAPAPAAIVPPRSQPASRAPSADAGRRHLTRNEAYNMAMELERQQRRPVRMFDRLLQIQQARSRIVRNVAGAQQPPTGALDPEEMERLATHTLQSCTLIVNNKVEETCCICLEDMQHNQLVRMLTCSHRMHAHCLKRWLRGKAVCICPLCKQTSQPRSQNNAS